jgi:hypothetical protein
MSGFWRMKNGKLIRISEMSDQHLLNTISMIERAKYEYWECEPPEYCELIKEAEYRGIATEEGEALSRTTYEK